MEGNVRYFVSVPRGCIIDTVTSAGRSMVFGETLDEIRVRYPDAQEMDEGELVTWKSSVQHTPIAWAEISGDKYEEMLCILPPAAQSSAGFLVGEPMDHDFSTGEPRYTAFRQDGTRYYESSRPITRREFRRAR